jgi:hypothetical protein
VTRARASRRGRTPRWRRSTAAAGLLCLALAPACAGAGPDLAPAPLVLERHSEERQRIDPDFLPAFDALHAAVKDGNDEVARRTLASILARSPPEHLLEFARGYERILDGRDLARALNLRLVSEPVQGSAADFRLFLEAGHPGASDVLVRLPPAGLCRTLTAVDAAGNESRRLSTVLTTALEDLSVPAGETVRVRLLDYELELGGALAVRERWTLDPRAGVFEVEGRELPAQDPPVEAAERTRLAPFLPTAVVEPGEVALYLERAEIFLPALIERAVRVTPEQREEALDLLTPVVLRLEREDPERLQLAAPALRWLARSGRQGGAPAAWGAWFEARRAAGTTEVLDVPGPGEAP